MTPRRLAEREGKPVALVWIACARAALLRPEAPLTRAGLETSFAFRAVPEGEGAPRIARIDHVLARVQAVLMESRRAFAGVSERAARRLFPGGIPPAYAIFGDRVYFTPAFARFGPMCRAAMVLHECVHLVDPRSGEPEVHVSEWDEPRFSSLSPDQAEHNPSAYACFAAQMAEERMDWPREARFGAGNPGV